MILLYPILLIVAVILFYILGKKNGTEKEVIKTVNISKEDEVNIYDDETEESYLLRCQNFIIAFFTKNDLGYLVSEDSRFYQLEFKQNNLGSTYLRVEPYYSNSNKYIICSTVLTRTPIEDSKLIKVVELLNRINCELIFSGLALNYESRLVTYKTTYFVGDQSLVDEYIAFHIQMANLVMEFLPMINRVTLNDEEPVIVALDGLNHMK